MLCVFGRPITNEKPAYGYMDQNNAQALRLHKAWYFIFYSDGSAGLLLAARPQRM